MEKKFHEEISKLTLAQPKPNNLNLYKQLSTTNKTRNNSNLVSNNSNTTTLKTNKMATTITTNFSRNKQINLEEIKKDTFFNNKDNNLSYFTDFKKHSSETENTIIKKNTDQAKPSVSILSPNLIFSGRLNYLDENEVNSKINDKELAQRNVNENSKIIFSNENHKNNIMNNTVYLNKTTKDRIKKLNVTDKSLNRIEDLLFNKSKDEKFKSRSNSNNSFHLTNKKKSIKSTLLNQINSLLTMIEKSPKERIYDKINVIKTQVKNIEDKSYVDKAEIDGNNDSDNSLKYKRKTVAFSNNITNSLGSEQKFCSSFIKQKNSYKNILDHQISGRTVVSNTNSKSKIPNTNLKKKANNKSLSICQEKNTCPNCFNSNFGVNDLKIDNNETLFLKRQYESYFELELGKKIFRHEFENFLKESKIQLENKENMINSLMIDKKKLNQEIVFKEKLIASKNQQINKLKIDLDEEKQKDQENYKIFSEMKKSLVNFSDKNSVFTEEIETKTKLINFLKSKLEKLSKDNAILNENLTYKVRSLIALKKMNSQLQKKSTEILNKFHKIELMSLKLDKSFKMTHDNFGKNLITDDILNENFNVTDFNSLNFEVEDSKQNKTEKSDNYIKVNPISIKNSSKENDKTPSIAQKRNKTVSKSNNGLTSLEKINNEVLAINENLERITEANN